MCWQHLYSIFYGVETADMVVVESISKKTNHVKCMFLKNIVELSENKQAKSFKIDSSSSSSQEWKSPLLCLK